MLLELVCHFSIQPQSQRRPAGQPWFSILISCSIADLCSAINATVVITHPLYIQQHHCLFNWCVSDRSEGNLLKPNNIYNKYVSSLGHDPYLPTYQLAVKPCHRKTILCRHILKPAYRCCRVYCGIWHISPALAPFCSGVWPTGGLLGQVERVLLHTQTFLHQHYTFGRLRAT